MTNRGQGSAAYETLKQWLADWKRTCDPGWSTERFAAIHAILKRVDSLETETAHWHEENARLREQLRGRTADRDARIKENKKLRDRLVLEITCYGEHIQRSARQCQDMEDRAKAAEAQVKALKKASRDLRQVLDILERVS